MNETESERRAIDPPFSPVLLAGFALAPIPVKMMQPVCDAVFRAVCRKHPGLLDRLSDYPDAAIGVDPTDLPFVLVLKPDSLQPSLTLYRTLDDVDDETTAIVRGPASLLIALGEGALDGDAVFFSRQLVVEGDTEVVVALRNAVDGADIDIMSDLSQALGPFGGAMQCVAGAGAMLFGGLAQKMEVLRRAIAGPAQKTADAQTARINELEAEITQLRRQMRKKPVAAKGEYSEHREPKAES